MKGILYGLVAIALWSTTATIGGLLEQELSFFSLSFYSCSFAALTLGLSHYPGGRRKAIAEIRASGSRGLMKVFIFGVLVYLYNITFYYAIFNAPRVESNIINYLWPVFYVILSFIFIKSSTRPTSSELAMIATAFLGAVFIAIDTDTLGSISFDNPAYLSALIAAITAGSYLVLIRSIKEHFTSVRLVYFLGLAFACPVFLFYGVVTGQSFQLSLKGFAGTLFLGSVVVSIGQVAWVNALRNFRRDSFASIAYLTPVASTILLSVFLGDSISYNAALGIIMIVLANIVLNSKFRYIDSLTGSLVFLLSTALICYLTSGLPNAASIDFTIISIMGDIFAILIGFTLIRMSSRERDKSEKLVLFAQSFRVLNETIDYMHDRDLKKRIDNSGRDFFSFIVQSEINGCHDRKSEFFLSVNGLDFISSVKDQLYGSMETTECVPKIKREVDNFERRGEVWLSSLQRAVGFGEYLVVWLLGLSTALMLLTNRSATLLGELTAVFLSSGIVFLLLVFRDYSNDRTGCSFSKLIFLSKVMFGAKRTIVLPKHIIDNPKSPEPTERFKIRVYDEEREWDEELCPESNFNKLLLLFFVTLGIIFILALFLSKYNKF